MEKLIGKYEKELRHLDERMNTALFIGDNQKIIIETRIDLTEKILTDLRGLAKSKNESSGLNLCNVSKRSELLRDFNDKLAAHKHYFLPATDKDIEWYLTQ